MDEFLKDRNEAFSSGDEKKIRAYCEKYHIQTPKDDEVFWAGVHKAICNLFLNEDSPITMKQYNQSFDWLVEHGYTPNIGKED